MGLINTKTLVPVSVKDDTLDRPLPSVSDDAVKKTEKKDPLLRLDDDRCKTSSRPPSPQDVGSADLVKSRLNHDLIEKSYIDNNLVQSRSDNYHGIDYVHKENVELPLNKYPIIYYNNPSLCFPTPCCD